MRIAQVALARIRDSIEQSVTYGLFTQSQATYLDSLKLMSRTKLADVLQQDEDTWIKRLEKAKMDLIAKT